MGELCSTLISTATNFLRDREAKIITDVSTILSLPDEGVDVSKRMDSIDRSVPAIELSSNTGGNDQPRDKCCQLFRHFILERGEVENKHRSVCRACLINYFNKTHRLYFSRIGRQVLTNTIERWKERNVSFSIFFFFFNDKFWQREERGKIESNCIIGIVVASRWELYTNVTRDEFQIFPYSRYLVTLSFLRNYSRHYLSTYLLDILPDSRRINPIVFNTRLASRYREKCSYSTWKRQHDYFSRLIIRRNPSFPVLPCASINDRNTKLPIRLSTRLLYLRFERRDIDDSHEWKE